MQTLEKFTARFPEFSSVPQARFDIFLADAIIEMGNQEERWLNVYDVAQANLIAHLITLSDRTLAGEKGAITPIRAKEVDDVVVEYGLSREQRDNFDAYNATAYGQQYIKWRRQVFAGARIA